MQVMSPPLGTTLIVVSGVLLRGPVGHWAGFCALSHS